MRNTASGCLLLLVALAGGFVLGGLAAFVAEAVTGNEQIAGAVGGLVLMLSFVLVLSYGYLFLYSAGLIRDESAPTSARRRRQREEGKLETAELRLGFIFAMVGGGCAHYARASVPIIIAWTDRTRHQTSGESTAREETDEH